MGCQLLRVLLKQVCDLLSKIFQFQKTWKLTLAPLLYKISPYWVSFIKHFFYFDISKSQEIKGVLSGLRNFWQLKAPEKWWKILLISCQKPFSFSRYLNFFLDFWIMYQNNFSRKMFNLHVPLPLFCFFIFWSPLSELYS